MVAAYKNNLHEQNVQHPDTDHESEVIKRSPTFTSSLVESESEEGYDRHNGNVFFNDEVTANVTVTNPTTTVSVVTENNDSEDGHTFITAL